VAVTVGLAVAGEVGLGVGVRVAVAVSVAVAVAVRVGVGVLVAVAVAVAVAVGVGVGVGGGGGTYSSVAPSGPAPAEPPTANRLPLAAVTRPSSQRGVSIGAWLAQVLAIGSYSSTVAR
jgi:hypothetical protein